MVLQKKDQTLSKLYTRLKLQLFCASSPLLVSPCTTCSRFTGRELVLYLPFLTRCPRLEVHAWRRSFECLASFDCYYLKAAFDRLIDIDIRVIFGLVEWRAGMRRGTSVSNNVHRVWGREIQSEVKDYQIPPRNTTQEFLNALLTKCRRCLDARTNSAAKLQGKVPLLGDATQVGRANNENARG